MEFDQFKNTLQSVDENGNIQTSFNIEQHTGFIIIKNAVLASAGVLEYAGHRLGLDGEDANKMFNVFQSEENLFNETNLKGANGVIVTEEHPLDRVVEIFDKGNFVLFGFTLERAKQIGKFLVNDIKITSASAISSILAGDTLGFSPGYEVEYIKQNGVYKNGENEIQYEFIKNMKLINHIALTKSPRNKETIFTDEEEKNMDKKVRKLFFQLQNGSTETITTDSIEEIMPMIVKQNQSILDLEQSLNTKNKIATDSSDKVAELETKIKELQIQLDAEKKKSEDAANKAENDSLIKDVKAFATKHQIKISNDSDDAKELLKVVVATDSGIDTKDLELNALKPMYELLKKQNSKSTTSHYNTGSANDNDDKDEASLADQTRNYFNGGKK